MKKNKPQSIFKTLGLMEHLEKSTEKEHLNTLFKVGNEGVMDTIKLSYYNSFTFDINEYDNFEKTLKDKNQSQLIVFENVKESIQKEVNMAKRTNPNEIKSITYEYIEDKNLIKLFEGINNGINPEVKLSYQGFALIKPTSIEGIDINNKKEKELIEQRKNNIGLK